MRHLVYLGAFLIGLAVPALAQDAPAPLSPEAAELVLSEILEDDLKLPDTEVRIEDKDVFVALNIAGFPPEDFTPALLLILMAAETTAGWSETVHVINYQEDLPLFVVQVATKDIAAFVSGELDDTAFADTWRFEGVE